MKLGELYLSGSLKKLDEKIEIDKTVILSRVTISKSEDIELMISRIRLFAEAEKKRLTDEIRRLYKDCRFENNFESHREKYVGKFDRKVRLREVDLLSGKVSGMEEADMKEMVEGEQNEEAVNPKKVFVVHGRNEKARIAMFDFLRSVSIEPIEWGEAIKATGKASPYIGDILKTAFSIAQAIIVLFTGDDLVKLRDEYVKDDDPSHESLLTPQARSNVIFEAGLAFGTHPDRTVLAVLAGDKTKFFSDIYGRHFVKLSNAPESKLELISRLKTAKCVVDFEHKKDWMKKGDFDGAVLEYSMQAEKE